eukprot:TRINITY_DN57268_c0_g1_i1.p1 TRINITY_DN57268_c0_g1~~TRINITY_DN57268_c0_g1_i1.p1  ORF type:complete len:236 (-),score=28.16 TRINITY_DN57268_c0_g1_i1:603-1310(-)
MYETHFAMQNHPLAISHFGGLAGYKLGAIGALGQPLLCAPLFRSFVIDAFMGANGSLSSSAMQMHTLEAEIALVMKTDLPIRSDSAPHSADDVWLAVEAAAPCIECCGRRTSEEVAFSQAPLSKFADCLSAGGALVGRHVSTATILPDDLGAQCSASLDIHGQQVAKGCGALCPLGGPLAALTWLANHLNERGLALLKGQVVITGATCKSASFAVGDQVVASFSTLGSVSLTICA